MLPMKITPFNLPVLFVHLLKKYRESCITFSSCNEVQMDTLISNQRDFSKRQEVVVHIHLPECLPAVAPPSNLPVEELTGSD